MSLAYHTARLYAAAQISFEAWCRVRRIGFPAPHETIAAYLSDCATSRGPSSVPVHLSAIALLYRKRGYALDTKMPVIQEIVQVARAAMPPKKRR